MRRHDALILRDTSGNLPYRFCMDAGRSLVFNKPIDQGERP
jgi:hypothetical protein